jgi:hypothetical protein
VHLGTAVRGAGSARRAAAQVGAGAFSSAAKPLLVDASSISIKCCMHAFAIGYAGLSTQVAKEHWAHKLHAHLHMHASRHTRARDCTQACVLGCTRAHGVPRGCPLRAAIHSSVSTARSAQTCCSRLSCFVLFERFACDSRARSRRNAELCGGNRPQRRLESYGIVCTVAMHGAQAAPRAR